MMRLLFSWLACSVLAAPAAADDGPWVEPYETAFTRAKKEGRYVVLEFYVDWCGTCQKMAAGPLAQPEVQRSLTRFVTARLDTDKHMPLAKSLQVDFLPTFLVMTPEGVIVQRFKGFVEAAEFTSQLDKALARAPKVAARHATLSAALAGSPDLATRSALADFYRRCGNLALANAVHDAIIGDAAMGPEARLKAAIRKTENLILMQRQDEAIEGARARLALDPNNPLSAHLLYLEGYAHETLGAEEAAARAYERVIALFPGSKAAQLAVKPLMKRGF